MNGFSYVIVYSIFNKLSTFIYIFMCLFLDSNSYKLIKFIYRDLLHNFSINCESSFAIKSIFIPLLLEGEPRLFCIQKYMILFYFNWISLNTSHLLQVIHTGLILLEYANHFCLCFNVILLITSISTPHNQSSIHHSPQSITPTNPNHSIPSILILLSVHLLFTLVPSSLSSLIQPHCFMITVSCSLSLLSSQLFSFLQFLILSSPVYSLDTPKIKYTSNTSAMALAMQGPKMVPWSLLNIFYSTYCAFCTFFIIQKKSQNTHIISPDPSNLKTYSFHPFCIFFTTCNLKFSTLGIMYASKHTLSYSSQRFIHIMVKNLNAAGAVLRESHNAKLSLSTKPRKTTIKKPLNHPKVPTGPPKTPPEPLNHPSLPKNPPKPAKTLLNLPTHQ
ncbi:hypothetical protein VP01_4140g1 [Puccinia sorghi]|uniref:Uncharacterized protein n=1 Tax=Puccinia sorghi TaxID=27349 RepID=A0A0L6UT10_9BASI|nr:hypothetical protein VP01_4140g1 [Puccinia sorghi]